MRKAAKISIAVLAAIFVLLFSWHAVLLNTDIFKERSEKLAVSRLNEEFPEFGEITQTECIEGFRDSGSLWRYRQYTFIFNNGAGETVLIEVCAHPPLRIQRTARVFPE